MHFFGRRLEKVRPYTPVNTSKEATLPEVPKSPAHQNSSTSKSKTFLISTVNYVNWLTQEILKMVPADSDPEMIKSVKLAGLQLNAVHVSLTGNSNGSHFPEKEQIAPNQLSWPSTAACMEVKYGQKRWGKVDSALTADHIGAPNVSIPTMTHMKQAKTLESTLSPTQCHLLPMLERAQQWNGPGEGTRMPPPTCIAPHALVPPSHTLHAAATNACACGVFASGTLLCPTSSLFTTHICFPVSVPVL